MDAGTFAPYGQLVASLTLKVKKQVSTKGAARHMGGVMITRAICDLLALSRSPVPGWWSCPGGPAPLGAAAAPFLNDFETIGK